MKSERIVLACSLLLIGLPYGARPALAENGRDFAGSYNVANVVDWGEDVSLTLTLQIFNYSGADVTDAVVLLNDSMLPGEAYADIGLVDVAYRDQVVVSQDVTVSVEEYEQWQEGYIPDVTVEYLTGEGDLRLRPVELLSAPVPMGGE